LFLHDKIPSLFSTYECVLSSKYDLYAEETSHTGIVPVPVRVAYSDDSSLWLEIGDFGVDDQCSHHTFFQRLLSVGLKEKGGFFNFFASKRRVVLPLLHLHRRLFNSSLTKMPGIYSRSQLSSRQRLPSYGRKQSRSCASSTSTSSHQSNQMHRASCLTNLSQAGGSITSHALSASSVASTDVFESSRQFMATNTADDWGYFVDCDAAAVKEREPFNSPCLPWKSSKDEIVNL
jgi:hypothetical protein